MSNYHYTFEFHLHNISEDRNIPLILLEMLILIVNFHGKEGFSISVEHESTFCSWCFLYFVYKISHYILRIFDAHIFTISFDRWVIVFVNVVNSSSIKQWHALYVLFVLFSFSRTVMQQFIFYVQKWQVHSQWRSLWQ